jgi:glycine/D-amino acid oxidase-like deaminating enzyme
VTRHTAGVVICGAGIAGISAAYHLTVRHAVKNVVLVDQRPPLTLTSDKSTEAYRNWWPGPDDAMIRLMNRSIDLLEALAGESGNRFLLNRRGYLYATANPDRAAEFRRTAELAARLGAGPLRCHTGTPTDPPYTPSPAEGCTGQPTGADLITDPTLIHRHYPYLSERVIAVLHTRRCGWFSGQQLGMYLFERALEHGARFLSARVEAVTLKGGRVTGVQLTGSDGSTTLSTGAFVNAAGPLVGEVAALLGIDLPVFSERHLKVSFKDHLGVIPRRAPLLIWEDPQALPWTGEERASLAASDDAWLLEGFPPGVHARPEGGPGSQNVLILWPYDAAPTTVTFPVPGDPYLPEIAMRGMSTLVPGLRAYFDRLPKPFIDGGYYTQTRENRLLSCPLPVEGAFLLGALSGFGLMASAAAAELLAAHITGSSLPAYAPAFSLARYADPAYRKRLQDWGPTGQL